MATYTTNYNLKKPDSSDPFGDFRGDYNDNLDIIDANLGGGGGSGGHTILDGDGNTLPQEDDLQFTGAVSVTDDNVNGRTVVDIKGGGLILDAQIYTDTEKVIGVWRDKKPLYQKTVNIAPIVSDASWHDIPHGISNIDNIVKVYGITTSQSAEYNPIPQMRNTTTSGITLHVTTTNIRYNCNWFSGGNFAYVTIQYTKTTDVAGSGGFEAYGFSPVIYSDVERVVGVWRDNKPLYQRTFDLGSDLSISYSAWVSSGVTLTNVENLITAYGTRSDNSFQGYVLAWNDNTDLKLTTPRNGNNSFIQYLTLQYTKTTDVAGSGDYNTLGVPTVHYSTTEQVIGTWFGKPLYKKTITKNNVAMGNNNGTYTSIPHGIADLNFAVDLEMVCPKLNISAKDQLREFANFKVDATNVFCAWGNNFYSAGVDRYWYITICYTKTTD